MNCPYCGAPLLETDTCCRYCQAAVSQPVAPVKKITGKGIRLLFIAVLLYCVTLLSIFYMLTDTARLTGTWVRETKVPGSDLVLHHQYEFTPFGIMSQTSGDITAKGRYKIQGNKILFTPNRNENATEEIEFRLSIDGKLYLKGDAHNPFILKGFPYAAIFLVIGVVSAFVASYIFNKKIIRPAKAQTDANDENNENNGAFDSYVSPSAKTVEYPMPKPKLAEEQFVSVDAVSPVKDVPYRYSGAVTPQDSAKDMEQNPFQRGGDL